MLYKYNTKILYHMELLVRSQDNFSRYRLLQLQEHNSSHNLYTFFPIYIHIIPNTGHNQDHFNGPKLQLHTYGKCLLHLCEHLLDGSDALTWNNTAATLEGECKKKLDTSLQSFLDTKPISMTTNTLQTNIPKWQLLQYRFQLGFSKHICLLLNTQSHYQVTFLTFHCLTM